MLSSHFKTGFRVLMRQKGYTVLNITGLALGIAVFTFIYLYIQSEISYDRRWSDSKNIYRITSEYSVDGKVEKIALTPFRVAEDIKAEFPEVAESTNMFFTDPSDINDVSSVTYNNIVYEIPDITLSGPEFFKIFDYEFIEGNPDSTLTKPNTMAISSEIAFQIFGNESAIGKKLQTVVREYTICGVFEKRCNPTHHNFDAVVSVSSLEDNSLARLKSDWYWLTCYTYIKVHDTAIVDNLEMAFNDFANEKRQEVLEEENVEIDGYFSNKFESISDVHFNTSLQYDSPSNSDIQYLYIFGIIAAFILLTASINYINLATAKSLRRVKEIGVRKVIGASKKQLVFQYISESIIITTIAFIIALSLVELLMPQFNILVGKELTLVDSIFLGNGIIFGLILLIMIIVLAIIGGSFPAFVLTSFKPANVLKGGSFILHKNGKQRFSAGLLRRFLVTVQYIVSIGLIISTFIIYAQMDFLNKHDLGFDKDNIFVINTPDDTNFRNILPKFIKTLSKDESIMDVSSAMNAPGYTESKRLFYLGDTTNPNIQTMNYYSVGYNYFELLKASMIEGSHFQTNMYDENHNHFVINEAAVNFLGLDTAIGTRFGLSREEGMIYGDVVGVVKNFHFSSLHRQVEPLVFLLNPMISRYIMVKFKEGKNSQAISHIRKVWDNFNEGSYLHFSLLDNKLQSLYKRDNNMLSLFSYFALFVIFISSLGLYGLTSFLIQQRTREIGIRRVLGGSEIRIVSMLAIVYLRVVLIAGVISSGLVYFLMNNWLNSFAYHITINGWYFLGGIILTLAIAFLTVTISSIRVVREKLSASLNYAG